MVGSSIWRILETNGHTNLIGRTSKELDLINQLAVVSFKEIMQADVRLMQKEQLLKDYGYVIQNNFK